jgi:KDO2-lipid IV(A) lauroyltransferase
MRSNIRQALGVDREEANRIAIESYRHLGRVFAETLSLLDYDKPEYQDLFEVEGFEHFKEAHQSGRGVILFTAHFGNWELMAARQAAAGYPIHAVAKPISNPLMDRWITRQRELGGNYVLGYKGMLLRGVRRLNEGHTLFIMPDQWVAAEPRLFLDFLGRRTTVTPFLAKLAVKLDVPVVPSYSIPRADGGYLFKYCAPVEHPTDGTFEEKTLELTRRVTSIIEGWIREYPEFWLWQHERWKTLPAESEEPEDESGEANSAKPGH